MVKNETKITKVIVLRIQYKEVGQKWMLEFDKPFSKEWIYVMDEQL